MNRVIGDLVVLYNLLFKPSKHWETHQERIEHFYKDQAVHYDEFRKGLLHGRRHLLETCTAFLQCSRDKELVWVDMGGGTAENILLMDAILPLEFFKKVYVVDICPSLCKVAEAKKEQHGWSNVEIVCCDAVDFVCPEKAHLVTFSYSLSMMPNYHKVIQRVHDILDTYVGIVGMVDFVVSRKYDERLRQMSWFRRFLWRAWFDLDGVDVGPERRAFVEHLFHKVFEHNADGTVPYLPFLRVPYCIWVGSNSKHKHIPHAQVSIAHCNRPLTFPSSFLYHQSWEDPKADIPHLDLNPTDSVLTLTSGGCNSLNLLLQGVDHVTSVDMNPAQNALLELKAVAIQELPYEEIWRMFGEGRHKGIDCVYNISLAPYLSELSRKFWDTRLHYFHDGLYHHGSMGKVSLFINRCYKWSSMVRRLLHNILRSNTLGCQKNAWKTSSLLRGIQRFKGVPRVLECVVDMLIFNPILCWYMGGVPMRQLRLLRNDGKTVTKFLYERWEAVLRNSHIPAENYFYYNILTAHYRQGNCPAYLKRENVIRMRRTELLKKLTISTDTFLNELIKRTYDKVILMDHADWLSQEDLNVLINALWEHVLPGGRVLFRSAGLRPPYVDLLEKAGFKVECVARADEVPYMDRVNMYSSFYVALHQ